MKIGNEGIHGLEVIAGVDENICPGRFFRKAAVFIDQRLQSSAGSRTDADDSAAVFPGIIEKFRCFFGNHAEF